MEGVKFLTANTAPPLTYVQYFVQGSMRSIFNPLIDALAGHITLDDWSAILNILRHRRPARPAFCPIICRPAAWCAFLISPGATPRPRRFDQITRFLRQGAPGPFNATTMAAHLNLHWPSEASKILAQLHDSGFLVRRKSASRVSFWLPPAPPGSPPGHATTAADLEDASRLIEPGLEIQQKL